MAGPRSRAEVWRTRLIVLAVAAGLLVVLAAPAAYRLYQVERVVENPVEAVAVGRTPDPTVVVIFIRWTEPGWCFGEFVAVASETPTQVRLDRVVDRSGGGSVGCAGVGTVNNLASADLRLKTPLGQRSVMRGSDGYLLPIYSAGPPP